MEGDTLIRVDGFAVTTEPAALRLGEFRSEPVRLTVRRSGGTYSFTITARPVCVGALSKVIASTLDSLSRVQRSRRDLSGATAQQDSLRSYRLPNYLTDFGRLLETRLHPFEATFEWPVTRYDMSNFGTVRWRTPLPPSTTRLGVGLRCDVCRWSQVPGGPPRWEFETYPAVDSVQPGSVADRIGLRRGDTLRTIDGLSLLTPAGGTRLGSLSVGQTITVGWRHRGVDRVATASLDGRTLDPADATPIRLSRTIGTAQVQVRGADATWTQDLETGELRIRVDSTTISIRPLPRTPPGS
jgi:hypothetical protein